MQPHEIYSLRARDVMDQNFVLVSPLATVQETVERMLESDCQVVIVDRVDEGDAYGMLTFQEIVYKVISRSLAPARVRVAEVMVKPLIVINPNLRLPFVAQLFANSHIEYAPVIEEHRLAGIVSSKDLVRALAAKDHG
jgi:CBS domain-containing protein